MIDINNQILIKVAAAVEAQYPNAYVTGEFENVPPVFPCVYVTESDNSTYRRSMATNGENHEQVTYTIETYFNDSVSKRDQARQIAAIADDVMTGLGFSRLTMMTTPNLLDNSVHRIVARYQAVVSGNETIYRG